MVKLEQAEWWLRSNKDKIAVYSMLAVIAAAFIIIISALLDAAHTESAGTGEREEYTELRECLTDVINLMYTGEVSSIDRIDSGCLKKIEEEYGSIESDEYSDITELLLDAVERYKKGKGQVVSIEGMSYKGGSVGSVKTAEPMRHLIDGGATLGSVTVRGEKVDSRIKEIDKRYYIETEQIPESGKISLMIGDGGCLILSKDEIRYKKEGMIGTGENKVQRFTVYDSSEFIAYAEMFGETRIITGSIKNGKLLLSDTGVIFR